MLCYTKICEENIRYKIYHYCLVKNIKVCVFSVEMEYREYFSTQTLHEVDKKKCTAFEVGLLEDNFKKTCQDCLCKGGNLSQK